MAPEPKVVNLRQPQGGRGILPAPLLRLRDKSAGRLQVLLEEFFDEADDALFAMSDKASSNSDQTAYFDAMRELRLQRKGMTLSFLQWMARAFNEIGRFEPRQDPVSGNSSDRGSLSLVEESVLEEQVALDSIVSKIRNLYNEQILLVHVRVEHLLPAVKLRLAQNPLGPEVLCQGFRETCADLEVDIRAKLIVFKLFDKLLVGRLGPIYLEANSQLAQDGVLPELRRAPLPGASRKSPAPHTGARVSGRASAQFSSGSNPDIDCSFQGDATFDQLSELLHGSARLSGFPGASGEGSGGNVSTEHLVGLLSVFQDKLQQPGIRMPAGTNLQNLVGRLIVHQQAGTGQVEQVDADVINLVSMLFDFILEDRQLPEAMKAMLARLQIPILKVALLDRSFFNRGGHPARKLLNELAMAAVGWSEKKEGQRDPLREKIESIVERFITEFDNDIGLIQTLLDDFNHFMDLDRRRRELVEQRLRDAEEGRARSLVAKEAVTDVLAKSRDGHQVPDAAQALIEDAWAKVLHWFYLREGENGPNWQQVVATTELLIWSVDPQPLNNGTRSALLKAIPQVVDAVREGLQTIGWDPFAADKLIRDLEMAHVDVLQNINLLAETETETETETAADTAPVAALSAPPVEHATASPAASVTPLRIDSSPAMQVPQPSINLDIEVPAIPVATLPVALALPVGQGSPAIAQAQAQAQSPAATSVDAAWTQRAENLRVGSWLELQEGEDRKLRCKLAAVIKATGKYIFVNRSGTKVAEYPLADVALAMAEKRLTMLDDGLIFDRALESVIGNLRSNRRD